MEAIFKLFSKQRPAAMMAQLINQQIISEDLDVIFDENRDRQYQRELLFSYLTLAVADVVMGVEKSPNKPDIAHQKEMRVSKTAFYDKLNNVETAISEAMIRHAFIKAREIQDLLGFVPCEQPINAGGKTLRRVTVKLDEPTRDGDTEIHILTNLPTSKADARKIVEVYRQRWEIENGFYILTTALTCEVKSPRHPRAALFVFCTAMLAYNSMRAFFVAMRAVWGEAVVADLSAYSLSLEISKAADGLNVLRTSAEWNSLLPTTPQGLAQFLLDLAEHVDISRHQKSHRGPKKKPPRQTRHRNGGHVATAKVPGLIPAKSP